MRLTRRRAGDRARNGEAGITLVEVLAAFTIFSIVALALTTFFSNAMVYAKGNQSKTVMVNLARNALFYMEKQPFEDIKAYFESFEEAAEIRCTGVTDCPPQLIQNGGIDQWINVLNPIVNDIRYTITIVYQPDITVELADDLDENMLNYLIPISVYVRPESGGSSGRDTTRVEGYITNERIR